MRSRRAIRLAALAATLLAAGWLWVPGADAACGAKCVLAPTPSNPNCKVCVSDSTVVDGCAQLSACRCLLQSCPALAANEPAKEPALPFTVTPEAVSCASTAPADPVAVAAPPLS